MLNQKLIARTSAILALLSVSLININSVNAQDITDVRWKSADKVKSLYGEPQSVRGPIGTHASYTLWFYDNFTVAFANERAFHLFKTGAEGAIELNEDRDSDQS